MTATDELREAAEHLLETLDQNFFGDADGKNKAAAIKGAKRKLRAAIRKRDGIIQRGECTPDNPCPDLEHVMLRADDVCAVCKTPGFVRLLPKQEPLGADFEKVLHDNLSDCLARWGDENYGSGAVQSAAETAGKEPSGLLMFNPAQEGVPCIPESAPATPQPDEADRDTLRNAFRRLTDAERLELMEDYCSACGCYDGDRTRGCQCWNDE